MFKKNNLKIINADCMDIMKGYEDNYFDLAIVDPPYNVIDKKKAKGFKKDTYKNISLGEKWDIKPSKNYFLELERISKNQFIFGFQYFMDFLKPTKNIFVWDKMNGDNFLNDCELAYNTCKGNNTIYKHAYIGRYHPEPKKIHPTQKPTKLYDFILKKYAKKDFKILDTHLGSGSSAIASFYYGCKEFIGVEIDENYYNKSIKRIKEKTAQTKLL